MIPQFFKHVAIGAALAAGAVTGAADAPAPTLSSDALLHHLNATIRWERQVEASRQLIIQPSDDFFWNNQQLLANQATQQAFLSAGAEVPLVLPPVPPPKAASASVADAAKNAAKEKIANATAARTARANQFQETIDALNQQLQSTSVPEDRAALLARRDALQAEVDLLKTEGDTLQKVGDIMSASTDDTGTTTLAGQIEALKRAVPGVFGAASAANAPAQTGPVETGGLIRRTLTLFKLAKGLRILDGLERETEQLQVLLGQIQVPLRATAGDIVRQGDQAAGQMGATAPGDLAAMRGKLETLSTEFKLLSAVSLPLRQESQLLDQSRGNLEQWRDSVQQQYHNTLWSLIGRIGGVAAMLILVFTLSEIWNRMTIRYVQEDRRRRQLLLIRRLVTGVLMVIVAVLGFSSDLGSLATFAGVITAGIAVALQTIILSMAAYFFMIGRSGLRTGDRITIAGVTGDVMHVGPVRFYVKELAGTGDDLTSTGRMAIFSNAVIFQHNPIFRPLPKEKEKNPPGGS